MTFTLYVEVINKHNFNMINKWRLRDCYVMGRPPVVNG